MALRKPSSVPPDDEEAFAWLLTTARKLAANQRRRLLSQERYWQQAVRELWHHDQGPSLADSVAERDRCLAALASLSDTDREVILLVAWEGLTAGQAAQVLGITRNAFTVRLHRARARLDHELDHELDTGFDPEQPSGLRPATSEGLS